MKMENETQSVSTETEKPQQPAAVSPVPESPKAKAAERRLKEMSKRAKQKGKGSEQKTKSKSLSLNPNWLLYGMGIVGIVGVGYLIFRTPAKTEYKFVPKKPPLKKNLSPIPEEKDNKEVSKSKTTFELNSF